MLMFFLYFTFAIVGMQVGKGKCRECGVGEVWGKRSVRWGRREGCGEGECGVGLESGECRMRECRKGGSVALGSGVWAWVVWDGGRQGVRSGVFQFY